MSILDDWKLRDIEKKADDALRGLNEIHSLRSDVDRLENSLRDARSETDGLRSELQRLQEAIRQLSYAC